MPATFYFEKNDIFKPFAEDGDGPFESNTRLLVFAASVGFARNNRVESPGKEGEIRWNYISQNKRLSTIVAALAYADHEDPDAILKPEMQIETLRRYGAGGARILEEEILDSSGSNLDNLISLIEQTQDQDQITKQVGILEEIESEISGLPAAQE
jgi:dnd system-associated protein 4